MNKTSKHKTVQKYQMHNQRPVRAGNWFPVDGRVHQRCPLRKSTLISTTLRVEDTVRISGGASPDLVLNVMLIKESFLW